MTKAPDFPARVSSHLALGMAWWSYACLGRMHSRRPFCCPPTGALLSRRQLQECSQGFKGLGMTKIFFALHLEAWRDTVGCLVFLSHFFACDFAASEVLQQVLDHFKFSCCHYTAHWEMPYCCCSLSLSDGDAIFSLTPLLSLAFSILHNQQALTSIP